MKTIKSVLIAAIVAPIFAASASAAELSIAQKNSIVNSLAGYKWSEQARVQSDPQQAAAAATAKAGFKWSKADQNNANTSSTDRVAKLQSADGVWAEQQGFKWVIKSAAEQQGFKWVIKSAAEQQGFKWVIKSSAEQQGFKWVIK